MKLVYTHENRFLVLNAKNIVDAAGIDTTLKNEYAAGAAGDLAPLDAWLELWVLNNDEYEQAFALIEYAFSQQNEYTQWTCAHCKEVNEATFDVCWSCQSERT